MVLGVAFATIGEYDYTALGFTLTMLGTFLSALKGIVTNRVQVGKLKLHPLDLLLRMSPLAALQCIVYAASTGELRAMMRYVDTQLTGRGALALLANGAIAFFLNVVSFTANKKTSALTMTVAANVRRNVSGVGCVGRDEGE